MVLEGIDKNIAKKLQKGAGNIITDMILFNKRVIILSYKNIS